MTRDMLLLGLFSSFFLIIMGMTIFGLSLVSQTNTGYPSITTTAGSVVASSTLPVITVGELARHEGSDASLPIYIGLDGYVYDVTSGKEYYGPKGIYHALAGKDSSETLHFFGGDIIKQKYPVIATLYIEKQ